MTFNLGPLDSLLDLAIKQMVGLKNALPETTDKHLSELGRKYELSVITDASKRTGAVTFDAINEIQKDMCGKVLSAELGIYDRGAIKACQLQRLILCTNLRSNKRPLNGLADIGRFMIDTLVLNAAGITTRREDTRATLHHELFHAIDYRDDFQHYADTEWRLTYKYNESLQFPNRTKFGKNAYFPPFNYEHLEGVPRGFLNRYATQSVREDKAVIYSWLIIRYRELMKIAQADAIVASKVAYMKNLLGKFHSSFDSEFWQKIENRSKNNEDSSHRATV
jgi:hypothetical protein